MKVKVTERVPNFVDLGRDPYVTIVSKIPDMARLDWIKEKNSGTHIILNKGAILTSDGHYIATYEFL